MGEQRYRARLGLNYVPAGAELEVRVEAGEELEDLSPASAEAFMAAGAIELVADDDGAKTPRRSRKRE
jgi:hypothetical protein